MVTSSFYINSVCSVSMSIFTAMKLVRGLVFMLNPETAETADQCFLDMTQLTPKSEFSYSELFLDNLLMNPEKYRLLDSEYPNSSYEFISKGIVNGCYAKNVTRISVCFTCDDWVYQLRRVCMIYIETCVYLVAYRYNGLPPFNDFAIDKGKCITE